MRVVTWWFVPVLALAPACAVIGLPGTNVGGCYPCSAPRPAARAAAVPLARFVALGDFGTAESGRNAEVAAALDQFLAATDVQPERVFELGDNFYDHGLIGAGSSCRTLPAPAAAITAQALSVLQPFEFLRDRGITLTAIPGNHDYGCNGQGLTNQVDIDRWLPPAHQWGNRWEILSGRPRELLLGNGAMQIVVLDSHRMITDRSFRTESARILEQLLSQGRARYQWQMIAAHHPLRTYGVHDGAWWEGTLPKLFSFVLLPSHALAALQIPPFDLLNQEAYAIRYVHYREAVEQAVQRSGAPVPLFLAGHDHQLQLLTPGAPGLPFGLVSGSAAKCAPVRAGDGTIFAAAKHGFAVVTAFSDHLDVDFIGTTACDVRTVCAGSTPPAPYGLFSYRISRKGAE